MTIACATGIIVKEIYQDDKSVPGYHEMKPSRMSVEIKFTAYNTPPHFEVDLLSYILLLPNDIRRRNKYEPSPYSSPSLVFGVVQINLIRTSLDMGTRKILHQLIYGNHHLI